MPLTIASQLASSINAPVIRQLPNGLTIIAEQMPIEAVNLSLWLKVGSAVESDAINGMAHFLEHMIFKGSPQIACGEFERLIEERGAVTNAATSQDYTHYYITTAPKDFADLAPLQIELVMNPRLTNDDFERERPVILEEIRRSEDNPRRRTFYRSMEMAFEQLPYRRPVLGPAQVIENLRAEQMRDFHAYWYRPSTMTAVAVGNLPVETLLDTVTVAFEQALAQRSLMQARLGTGLPITQPVPFPTYAEEQPFPTIHRFEQSDKSLQQARLVMSWRVPGMVNLQQTYALDVLASVLGRGRTSRLVRDLREERNLVTSISASNMTYDHQGVFSVSAQLAAENIPAVEAAIATHVATLCQEPVKPTELQRVRTQVANRFVFGNETPSDRAGLYGYYQAITGNIHHALTYPESIQAVQIDDILAAAQQYLKPDAYGVLTVKPER